MNYQFDIAVVGSGFAGSLIAMIAKQFGHSVVLIEKGRHPRIAIGESSTPLSNILLEELATRYDLPALKPLTKWGTWQTQYPEVACGLKRGFTFYHHDLNRPKTCPDRSQQLLVAASPNDEISDTHWYRADFDDLLVRKAQQLGVEYLDETHLISTTQSPDGITLLGNREERGLSISTRFLIDASGPRGFLHRALQLCELELPNFPKTRSLYSHFSGVNQLDRLPFGRNEVPPPYPIDDAAVHHLFDGGWIWVLKFNNGVTSAGIAATDKLASDLNLADGERAWQRILQHIPVLQQQFANAKPELAFTHIPSLSFRSATVVGPNWALLPSAAGFVDPLLSTGFPLTLLGITRLVRIIEHDWNSKRFAAQLDEYAAQTDAELLATSHLIAALYANMNNFPVFTALSLLYFAAASFSETTSRLGKPHLASSFLLHDHPAFGSATTNLLSQALHLRTAEESARLEQDIYKAIEPFNVAGLGDPPRRNWYPVEPSDLLRSAPKLGATKDDIVALLHRCGIQPQSQATQNHPDLIST